jgi:hypothetical protein
VLIINKLIICVGVAVHVCIWLLLEKLSIKIVVILINEGGCGILRFQNEEVIIVVF